jgi:hypothetical protein
MDATASRRAALGGAGKALLRSHQGVVKSVVQHVNHDQVPSARCWASSPLIAILLVTLLLYRVSRHLSTLIDW